MSRRIRFRFSGTEGSAVGTGRCGDVVARSLARRLGVPVTLWLRPERREFRADYEKNGIFHQEVVAVLSEEAW